MTDRDYEAVYAFHKKVREAFRQFKEECDDWEDSVFLAQDGLSLFSPWMHNEDDT